MKKKKRSLVENLNRFKEVFDKAKEDSIDLKKVNRLRKKIREGQYEIDFEKLAEKIIKDHS